MQSNIHNIHTILPRWKIEEKKKLMSNNIIAAIIESIKKCTSTNQNDVENTHADCI